MEKKGQGQCQIIVRNNTWEKLSCLGLLSQPWDDRELEVLAMTLMDRDPDFVCNRMIDWMRNSSHRFGFRMESTNSGQGGAGNW